MKEDTECDVVKSLEQWELGQTFKLAVFSNAVKQLLQ